jgi:hypothetical protein
MDEDQLMNDYVNKTSWPSYDMMISRFGTDVEGIMMYAEYGEFNHNALKEIYESSIDTEVAWKWGQKIADRGGITALQQNCIVFMRFGPLAYAPNQTLRANARLLEFAWDGIKDKNGDVFFA